MEANQSTGSSPTDAGVTFRETVDLDGKTATGIEVPEDVVAALGTHKQPLVHVTIGSHSYRSKVAVRGGEYKLPISAKNRAGAGVAAGDEVDITLVIDTEPREVEKMAVAASGQGGLMVRIVPEQAEALEAEPHARPFEMRGRPVEGWLRVDAEGVGTKAELEPWVTRGVAYARSLPAKS